MELDNPLVQLRATLNPYFYGVGMVLKRLLWDLNPQSWIARRKISKWKNKFAGEKAIILCNGPSLRKVDFKLIEKSGLFTFGLNKINLLFDSSIFRPDCIVSVNPLVIEQNKEFYNSTNIPLFIDSVGVRKGWVASRKDVIFLHSGGKESGFAKDCSMSMSQGYTVTYVALQLAFHMGFKDVALVGADHSFVTKGPANKTVDGGSKDESHFDPRYFSNVKWQLPDLFESEVSYTRAKNIYEAHGRKVVNCTVGGKLEVFERSSLEDFIKING